MVMDPPGGGDERRRQAERLRREEAYYHFINDLSEEEYRLMRDSNLLGTPGEVTAEELQQRLDGAKERESSQPITEQRLPAAEPVEQQGSSGEDRSSGGRRAGNAEPGAEASNGDSLLEWLNTFRRTGNATRSGQSGNQTWRAVSRTNPNSGEFRFSLEININHDQPEAGEHADALDSAEQPAASPGPTLPPSRTASSAAARPSSAARPSPYPTPRPALSRRMQTRRTRSSSSSSTLSMSPPAVSAPIAPPAQRRGDTMHTLVPSPTVSHSDQSTTSLHTAANAELEQSRDNVTLSLDCPRVSPQSGSQAPAVGQESRRTRSRGRWRRVAAAWNGGAPARTSRRSRSPLHRSPVSTPASSSAISGSSIHIVDAGTSSVSMETGEAVPGPAATATEPTAESGENESHSSSAGGSSSVRRHPTIMLDLQVRRIRPGENRDRDSIASRTRSRARVAENTVTFESDSGGFRRTISRSERAGIRTYVSTIRIPLRRISETGLGEPNSTALRSILRQIMTGFGELSSLMETEADSESVAPAHVDVGVTNTSTGPAARSLASENTSAQVGSGGQDQESVGPEGNEEEQVGQARLGGGPANAAEGRPTSRDTNNLVENGTLPILRLAQFFLLNDEDDDEHPRGLTKEQIDNLATRSYGQASLEGEAGRACSVCINEYAQGNKLRRLPCAHEFHIHCIDRWLSENNTCPICRQPILAAHHD
ncbi:E3 ubiquitin-protein ligase RNF6 [Phycodurus eques]|uniref:E3 ubiquitin-protein ligase RNF6 n=1 Tax=Phycodurus eques TaxID=693459 RepID=UPI002ACE06CC|nr:E3 ubiquitin-protein ligase RNF6 [Phycodurus eques]